MRRRTGIGMGSVVLGSGRQRARMSNTMRQGGLTPRKGSLALEAVACSCASF